MNSHEVFIHIHQGCFAGTGAIVRLPQCQWSKPDWYGKISQCITTTKHSKAKIVCIFLWVYCMYVSRQSVCYSSANPTRRQCYCKCGVLSSKKHLILHVRNYFEVQKNIYLFHCISSPTLRLQSILESIFFLNKVTDRLHNEQNGFYWHGDMRSPLHKMFSLTMSAFLLYTYKSFL